MSFLDGLLAGKYKGISFYVRSERKNNVGRTRVKHTYPKSSIQYAEDMGNEPFDVTIDVFFKGENYKEDAAKFEQALRSPAPGRLFSPTFGLFNSIVADPVQLEAGQNTLGEISASVHFYETISKPAPIEATLNEEDVSDLTNNAQEDLQGVFENEYSAPSIINNLTAARADAGALASGINGILKNTNYADEFLRKVNAAITNPTLYASLLLSSVEPFGFLIGTYQSILNTGATAFDTFKKLSTIGNDFTNSMDELRNGITPKRSTVTSQTYLETLTNFSINLWEPNTAERIDRNTSRLAIINCFRVMGLMGMYESAASKDYTTTTEIEKTSSILDEYYENLIENDETITIIKDMTPALSKIKASTNEVLTTKKQQAYTVIEIEILRPTSSFLLAYQLYGEYLKNNSQHEYFSNLIANLNRSQARNRMVGIVKVVEIGR